MKQVTNTSLQSWSLPFTTPEGVKSIYLTPKQSVTVPSAWITEYIIRYQQRSLISIKNV